MISRANSSSVAAARAGALASGELARAMTLAEATTAAPASKASKSLFGVPVPRSTGSCDDARSPQEGRHVRNRAHDLDALAPVRSADLAGRVGSAHQKAGVRHGAPTRGQMSRSSRRTAKRFGRYMRRPVKATAGARSAGPGGSKATPFATARVPAGRCAASNGVVARRAARAPRGPRLGGREAGRLDGPVRPAPRRRVVPCRLARGLGERVHEVHDTRERRQRSEVRQEAREEDADEEVRPVDRLSSAGPKDPANRADCRGSPDAAARARAAGSRERSRRTG